MLYSDDFQPKINQDDIILILLIVTKTLSHKV